LVKDLDQAIERYQILFGDKVFQYDQLEQRAVKAARIKLGETWLILVQPLDQDSIPAKHLKQHGEGFFLLSLASNDIDETRDQIESQLTDAFPTPERTGLDNWRVLDFQLEHFFGAQLQLTEEA